MSRPSSFHSAVHAPGFIVTDSSVEAIRLAEHQSSDGNLFVQDWSVVRAVRAHQNLDDDVILEVSGNRAYSMDPGEDDKVVWLPDASDAQGTILTIANRGLDGGFLVLIDEESNEDIAVVGNGYVVRIGSENGGSGWRLIDVSVIVEGMIADAGTPGSALMDFSAQVTATDTLGIGDDTYEFVAEDGTVADDANIAVQVGADAAGSLTNIIDAINAEDDDNQHANIEQSDASPALANGTEDIAAVAIGTDLVIMEATDAGGDTDAKARSVVLAESMADGTHIWNIGNENMNTVARARTALVTMTTRLTVTDAMLLGRKRHPVVAPFTPTMFNVQVFDTNGVLRTMQADAETDSDDAFAIEGDSLMIVFAVGGATDIISGDEIQITLWGEISEE